MSEDDNVRLTEAPWNQCPVCGAVVAVGTSDEFGDTRCPSCDQRLFFLKSGREARFFAYPAAARVRVRYITQIAKMLGVAESQITPQTHPFDALGADSLDRVELVMELEEEFDSQ